MINSSIAKVTGGKPRNVSSGNVRRYEGDSRPAKNSSINGNKYTASNRCGYGVMGVAAYGAGGSGGGGRSQRRSAGGAPDASA